MIEKKGRHRKKMSEEQKSKTAVSINKETEKVKELIKEAISAREFAYAPYSHFKVGAALLDQNGNIYQGCNIENAAYGPSNCAERTAIFKAVSEGSSKFSMIAIIGGLEGKSIAKYAVPCGVCRQVMSEFCNPEDFRIIMAKSPEDYQIKTLEELLPMGFGAANII